MAAHSVEYNLRSPFESVLKKLPQGEDKALKQAFYNTGANLFAVLVCLGAIAVYYILEIFLRPLLWAVLCGTFLHPFKNTLASLLKRWLRKLRKCGTPLVVGTAVLPFQILDTASESLGSLVIGNLKTIIYLFVGLISFYILYYFGPLQQMFGGLQSIFYFVYETIGYFSAFWVWSVVAGYLALVLFLWTPQTKTILKHLSIPVWIAVLFHLAGIAGPLRVPIVLGLILLLIIGFISDDRGSTELKVSGDEAPFWKRWLTQESPVSPEPVTPSESTKTTVSGVSSTEGEGQDDVASTRPQSLSMENTPERKACGTQSVQDKTSSCQKTKSLTDHCFIALIWAIILVRVWMHLWILQLLPVLVAFLFIKKLGVQVGSWKYLQEKGRGLASQCRRCVTEDSRANILAPKPVRGLVKFVLKGDRKVVSGLENSIDKAISALIVCLLLVGTIMMTFFIAIQVHRESMYMVSMTSNVVNNSLNPELAQWCDVENFCRWLPDQDDLQKAIDSMLGKAYMYGREWIADKIHSALNGNDADKSHVEQQVLEVWDRVYENWFARNTTSLTKQHSAVDFSNLTNVFDALRRTKNFDLDLVSFFKDNIDVFMQVLDSVWKVLKGNMSLALNVLTATLSLVFGGGTALLNLILSLSYLGRLSEKRLKFVVVLSGMWRFSVPLLLQKKTSVIFMTTLFYLLASSGQQYKPVEWFSSMNPAPSGTGNRFGAAVEEAISSVFLASLKMAVFYGLYTWLIHTVFGIQIVFIPSALASIFAAIPFVGTYWAAVPAVIELWLVKGKNIQAMLLFGAQMLPSYVVDTAIYSEIKGGHPYMTGLSIAGGMYWLGLEGAIIGPILLCCLIVAMNVYSSMLQSEDSSAGSVEKHLRGSGFSGQKRVSFSLRRADSDITS